MARFRTFVLGFFVAAHGVMGANASADPVLEGRVSGGKLLYKRCPSAPCVPTEADGVVALPPSAQQGGAGGTDIAVQTLSIGAGAQVLWAHGSGFDALVGMSRANADPRVLFAGPTGLSQGETGERHGDVVQVTDAAADGSVHVLLGEVREDIGLCGRPAILSPKVLDAKDLGFKAATVQRLSAAERASAEALVLRRHDGLPVVPLARVLRGSTASSAIGAPGAITDGDLETTWAENRGGDGHGEFVQMNAPVDVEITKFAVTVRPPTRAIAHGVGPRKMWLAADGKLFSVSFPEDPWQHAGTSYDVTLTTPLKTSCLALVLDEAYARGESKDMEVTVAEVTALSPFDGASDLAGLVGALAGGGTRARMAAAILTRGGSPAFQLTADGYDKLDDAGRVLALEVLDGAPCAISAPVYTRAMVHGFPGESHHAETRLSHCGKDAVAPLALALEAGPDKQRVAAAQELSLVAPPVAIDKIVDALPGASKSLRRELRGALATAAKSERASDELKARLTAPQMPVPVLLDLLRAAADRPDVKSEASAAFSRIATAGSDFATRYLLLTPAARLSTQGDGGAQTFLENALRADQDAHVRARAAEALGEVPTKPDTALALVAGLSDVDPRVRDAALSSLKQATWPPGTTPHVTQRLLEDPWTFVRVHAAEALTSSPAGNDADAPLGRALRDVSPLVRAQAVETLGARGAVTQTKAVRDRLEDEDETPEVRTRAARALGALCDRKSIDLLTEVARAGASPTATGEKQTMGAGAAAALGRLHPSDLAQRLAPLLAKDAARTLHDAAQAAVAETRRCNP